MLIEKNSTLVMIGDSITDCGRKKPIGEGVEMPDYGNGYVQYVVGALQGEYPQKNLRIINMGIGGNTVRDLKARWQTDVFDLKPDWLSIKIGINDVWRQFGRPDDASKGVLPKEFEATYDELIQATKPQLKGLILLSPFYIEPNKKEPMRKRMDEYGAIVKKLAKKHKAIYVDTQTPFDQILKHRNPMSIAGDRVHPNVVGHTAIAEAFLKAIKAH